MDIDGRRYGQAQAGGSILLGGALDWDATGIAESARDIAIVVRPGAVLDASGSRLAIDAPRGSRLGTLDLAGDGGQIVLKSSYGLFLDGDMRARAGGAGAAGGTLALALETPTFPLSVNAEDGVRRPRELIYRRARRPAAWHRISSRGSSIRRCIMARRACQRGSSRPAASATCRCWSTGFSVSTATWPCRPRKACASMPAVMP